MFEHEEEPFFLQSRRPYFFMMGLSATIFYGILWRYFLPQPYENFIFRGMLAALIIFNWYLRYTLRVRVSVKNIMFYAHFIGIGCFIFTMYIRNGAQNMVWAGTSVCGIYLIFGAMRFYTGIIVLLASALISLAVSTVLWGPKMVFVWSTDHSAFSFIVLFAVATAYNLASNRDIVDKAKSVGAQTAIAVLAHEVRSPLFALRAGLYNIHARLLHTDKESVEFGLLENLTRRIDDVNGVLNFHLKNLQLSQNEKYKLAIERVRVEEVVKDAFETLGIVSGDTPIELNIQPGFVMGNREGIRQIMINLIKNGVLAVRAVGGGRVVICAVPNSKSNEYTFSVEDSAGTLNAAEASQVFEPFVSFRKDQGIGIGLYASKLICRAMAATLAIKVTPKVSTVFSFCLPTAE